jgi:hypothetical protein
VIFAKTCAGFYRWAVSLQRLKSGLYFRTSCRSKAKTLPRAILTHTRRVPPRAAPHPSYNCGEGLSGSIAWRPLLSSTVCFWLSGGGCPWCFENRLGVGWGGGGRALLLPGSWGYRQRPQRVFNPRVWPVAMGVGPDGSASTAGARGRGGVWFRCSRPTVGVCGVYL